MAETEKVPPNQEPQGTASGAWRQHAWAASGAHQPPWAVHWGRRRRRIFRGVGCAVGFMGLLVVGGMAVLAFLLTRFYGGSGPTALLVWMGGIGLALGLPLLALLIGLRTVRGFALPLTDILSAIDAVAEGDLSVRVPEPGRGEMARLASSFNRMLDELERTERQRRNLTADVAHELRTPLHVIQGNLEGILDGVYPASPEQIEATLQETRLLNRLVDDLRTLSLADAGELSLNRVLTPVEELLQRVASSYQPQARGAGVELRLEISPYLPAIHLDPERLVQVLGNLMGNAIRYTPRGGTVSLRGLMAGEWVLLQVADTGRGIDPEQLPHIFERFYRADSARTVSESESGLGLSIAKSLVELHGGKLTAESVVGQGTVMSVWLPIEVK